MSTMNYPKRIYVLPARQQQQQRPVLQRPVMQQPVMVQRHAPKRSLQTDLVIAELLGDEMGPSGPRKRERLNHLSQEEKMDRRKLKNRVAAQNARDKKKERSAKIEDVMRDLVEENRRLRAENEMLRRKNEQYRIREEQQQQETMYMNNENVNDSNIYSNVAYEEEVVGEVEDRAFESAVFINAPQQREQARSFNRLRCTNSDKKTISVDTYLTIISILCNHMDHYNKKMNTSNESSNISKAHLENSIDSLLTTLRKEETAMRHLLQADPTVHLQKRVKHFRRVP